MSYMSDRAARKNGLLPPLPTKKERKPIAKKSAKKIAEEKAVKVEEENTELQKWYAAIMEREEGRCWETGERINKEDKFGWKEALPMYSPNPYSRLWLPIHLIT